jgi:hypothetical protein
MPYVGMTSPSHMKTGKWCDWNKIVVRLGQGKIVFESYDDPRDLFEDNQRERLGFEFLQYAHPARTFYRQGKDLVHWVRPSREVTWSDQVTDKDIAVPLELVPETRDIEYVVRDFQPSRQLEIETRVDGSTRAVFVLGQDDPFEVRLIQGDHTLDTAHDRGARFEPVLAGVQRWAFRFVAEK